jgi:hypothetical protein
VVSIGVDKLALGGICLGLLVTGTEEDIGYACQGNDGEDLVRATVGL